VDFAALDGDGILAVEAEMVLYSGDKRLILTEWQLSLKRTYSSLATPYPGRYPRPLAAPGPAAVVIAPQ
jgi:hypothetical protein